MDKDKLRPCAYKWIEVHSYTQRDLDEAPWQNGFFHGFNSEGTAIVEREDGSVIYPDQIRFTDREGAANGE